MSIYVKDKELMDKIKEKSAEQDRTISNWAYLVVRNAVLGYENDKQNKRSLVGATVSSHKHQPEPEESSPGVTEL